jgi:hypothetical protein
VGFRWILWDLRGIAKLRVHFEIAFDGVFIDIISSNIKECSLSAENDQLTIAEKFSKSWDEMVEFFTHLSAERYQYKYAWLKPLLGLIAELRARGYDRQFRAGQSMYRFVLSRSPEWSLYLDVYLSMEVQSEGGMIVCFIQRNNPMIEIKLERVELAPELEDLLARLLVYPIA